MLPDVATSAGLPFSGATTQFNSLMVALDANEQSAARRRAVLATEARRIARRRAVAQAVAVRSRHNDRGLAADASVHLAERASRKTTRLSLGFHRTIELLWEAGGFDEAMAIVRESHAVPEPHVRFHAAH